jgi:glucokinase
MRILAGDIGGTNTRLAVYEIAGHHGRPALIAPPAKYKNVDHASFDAILQPFLASQSKPLSDACFGLAGPVEGREVTLTNVPRWPIIRADDIAQRCGITSARRVTLLNDMPAHAASIGAIEAHFADQIVTLRPGDDRPHGMRCIVAPGTGLGIGGMFYDEVGDFHRPFPTEGGHADLPAREAADWSLVESMRALCAKEGLGRVTRELVLSGPGLRRVYACLRDPRSPTLDGVPTGEALAALDGRDDLATRTLDTFTRILGATCADLAFGFLATGGVYLAGGIANSTLRSRLSSRGFLDAFEQSGPASLRSLIATIPVKLVTFDDTGLLGAASHAAHVSGAHHA